MSDVEKFLLGSYTRRISEGIYEISLDTKKKELVHLNHLINEDNPTYLDVSNKGILYSVAKEGNLGGVASYKTEENGEYTLINRVMVEGAPPCYVAVDNKRQVVYGANYHQGILYSYTIDENGAVSLADKIQDTGNGPHENQDGPHVHYADLTPDNRLVVCDLGNDTVYTYDVDNNGKLTEVAKFIATPGTGPRHLVFHPTKPIAYLFGELSSNVIALDYDVATGSFKALQTISTLPETHTEFNGGAAIRISKNGKFLYASNRGHNSLVVYEVSEDGKTLNTLQWISVEGDFPRDFNLSKNEDFIVVANQNSDNLTLFERNKETGLLTLLQKDVFAPEVVCVKNK
ncbi:lactonase family protein [Vagococcus sp. CY53-2]|uniref:lactonase family protein n=1 Tax=Vagococcus sp. CY53-2 TaxID=2925780 RepID=UPI001F509BF5|nr:lactonase family protein [Vagococcus sp. CY53-2]MCI0130639.1 lactonase family protein [Vagococcus sp. CY53-2]